MGGVALMAERMGWKDASEANSAARGDGWAVGGVKEDLRTHPGSMVACQLSCQETLSGEASARREMGPQKGKNKKTERRKRKLGLVCTSRDLLTGRRSSLGASEPPGSE